MTDEEALSEALVALKAVEDDGGVCEVMCNPTTRKIEAVIVSTATMITNIKSHVPDLVLLDTTFGTNVDKYKLATLVYPCRRTNGTRVAAFVLLSDERDGNVQFMLEQFRNICQPPFFFVDKDFHQLSLLNKLFPSSTTFLCIFHVLKYMRTVIATANAQVDKEDIFRQLKRLIHSRDNESFEENVKKWKELLSISVVVKINGKIKSLEEYFDVNWLADDGDFLWATYHRRGKPLLYTNTTNRIESLFASLKKDMRTNKMAKCKLASFIPYLLSSLKRREFRHNLKVKRFRPRDSRFQGELDQASLSKLTALSLQLLNLKFVDMPVVCIINNFAFCSITTTVTMTTIQLLLSLVCALTEHPH